MIYLKIPQLKFYGKTNPRKTSFFVNMFQRTMILPQKVTFSNKTSANLKIPQNKITSNYPV
jgi:hypothetical protein